jgi:hypothetical protein
MLNTTANEEIEQPESDLCNDTNVAINCNILSDDNRGSNVDNSLRSRLALWGCNHNITHSALNDLLIVLQSEVSEKLPIDARTLMKTTGNVMVERMGTGQYYYFGIGKFLVKRIKAGLNAKEGSFPIIQNMQSTVTDRIVSLSVGIDGLPVAKSNNKSFWPIIGLVDQSVNPEPFLIALYLGIDKPPVDTYLRDFVNEMHELELSGVVVNYIRYNVRISALIADAPARSFVKCTKNHNAYYGCDKCEDEGEWEGRVILTNIFARKRTDSSFREIRNEPHHKGESPLLKLQLGLVSQIPLDYMHLICLGVMRKLINAWIGGPLMARLQGKVVKEINAQLEVLRDFIPREFARKTRSWREVNRYKATEFRLFLLYVGPVVLYKRLTSAQYEHFLILQCATYILINHNAAEVRWNTLAQRLIERFIESAEILYGKTFLIYNVHALSHITDDALSYGSLDNFSAFPFENFMQVLKRFIRSKNNYLEQVVKRVLEREEWVPSGGIPITRRLHNRVSIGNVESYVYKDILISTKRGNNCFVSNDDLVLLVNTITCELEHVFLICRSFKIRENLLHYPCPSKDIGICRVSSNSLGTLFRLNVSNIKRKCVLLPVENGLSEYICIPFGKLL